jgi:subtilase family serine protease
MSGVVSRLLAGIALALAAVLPAVAQTAAGSFTAPPLITEPIDRTLLVALSGNTRPEANPQNDRGAVPDGFPMSHMMLQLKRSPTREQALGGLIEQLHDPASPEFHHWLTPTQVGEQFGLAASDLQQITDWLTSEGFQVDQIYPSGMVIDFSGNAGQVRAAFRTQIHMVSVKGALHFANMSDPQIPAALAPAVAGIVSLHDFRPKPQFVPRSQYSEGSGTYAVVPADLATIYNFNPLFNGGVSGQGQTIYLIEDTDLFTDNDWTKFRSTFGLSSFTGASLTTMHPSAKGGSACSDPGHNADDGEAILDAEYASAAVPSAAIVIASCADTSTFGGLIAIQNLINGSNPPAIISMSYEECEATNGATANAAYNSAYQQGVAEGTSIFVAAGDQAASLCDIDITAMHGIGVNAFASTPYNVAVGGTDFSDTLSGTNSNYWSSTNNSTFGSVRSYVPEIPWNDSCASQLTANFYGFSVIADGLPNFCDVPGLPDIYLEDLGGSGGPSGCATGSPSFPEIVSGTCAGYAKPSYQSGVLNNPSDGVRDLPDVSLFAANGIWDHYYVYCWSDIANGGAPCTGAPSTWSGAGGTSFGSPIMAGVQALVNQYTGASQGNPNYTYYRLAAAEYGSYGSNACNSSSGNGVASSCVFYEVTLGDNDVPCSAPFNCYFFTSGTIGVLSTSDFADIPAYTAGAGWNFATGLGTINVANLVSLWSSGLPTYTLTVSASGAGTVTSSPPGINCGSNGSTCSADFTSTTQIYLTETPGTGSFLSGWGGACNGGGACIVTMNGAESVSANFAPGSGGTSALAAAVLPESRSAVVNNTVTAFATIVNSSSNTASGCAIAPIGNPSLNFAYQTTNPGTNALTGTPNAPMSLSAGAAQSFVIALTPTAAFNPTNIDFSFACSNIPQAPIVTGLNTLLLSASTTPVPDVVALAATMSNDGILHIPAGSNSFAVATVNLGAGSTITATVNTGAASLPLALSLCETNPITSQCVTPLGSSATVTINTNATPTFGIFATANSSIAFDPAGSRVFVQFTDPSGAGRGATSVAVETQ